jgi:hypothetical protein
MVFVIAGVAICLSAPGTLYAFGDWFYSFKNKDFFLAATINAAGHLLGQYCYFESESCIYIIGIGITCTPGHQYPVLVNSDAGSSRVSFVCSHKYEDQYVLAINTFDDIDRVIRKATRVGFAVPMQNDDFKVARFSLRGAAQTIDFMLDAAETRMNRKLDNRRKPAEERL